LVLQLTYIHDYLLVKAEEAGFVEVSDAVVIVAATLDSLSFVEQSENNH